MKRVAFCLCIGVFAFCLLPFGAADGVDSTETAYQAEDHAQEVNGYSSREEEKPSLDENTVGSAQTENAPVGAAPATSTAPATPASAVSTGSAGAAAAATSQAGQIPTTALQKSGSDSSAADTDEKSGETADLTFASIHSKGLTVADGNKWYYENFDRQGRPSFAVLYENGTALEKTEWQYKGNTRHPAQKRIVRPADSEIFRYDEEGRELSIELYTGKTLTSKTENVYNGGGKLIEQTVTAGKNIERSVWEFSEGTAVSQTKYRNGKKTAFIELDTTPHIVHLYMDDKEVYVGAEV